MSTPEQLRRFKAAILAEVDDLGEGGGGPLCDKVVAVLGDENFYPCKLPMGHDGRCEPDYNA